MLSSFLGLGASFAAAKLMKNIQHHNVQVLHAMPGRVRLQCDRWKDAEITKALEEALEAKNIVRAVRANPVTGTLVLEFKVQHLSAEEFDELIQHAVQTTTETYGQIDSKVTKTMRGAVNRVDENIKKQTAGTVDIDALLILLLVGKGISGFKGNPAFSSSLLYWAYNLLQKERGT
ncbi:HMA2 domain-containing protein [Bacillus taeanensis]|uniref:Uncharacterized protein n=1 Tax=Bacillus taeanensis TaxID=273032 RepID=A0A366XQZ5_9BACI|nr:hypothetical protein [Bacillus taeanensis]RBW68760.1 hypothetical protein DS031_14535 [Bacillus taeanensis]